MCTQYGPSAPRRWQTISFLFVLLIQAYGFTAVSYTPSPTSELTLHVTQLFEIHSIHTVLASHIHMKER